jgi:hypothetical protein
VSPKLIAVLATVGVLGVAPHASAAGTLHATPSPGSSPDCTAVRPCALSTALSTATTGDTVVVGAGTYSPVASYSDGGKSLTIAGAVIGPGRPVVNGDLTLSGPASRVTDLAIHSSNPFRPAALDLRGGAGADRIVAIAETTDGCYVRGGGTTLSNSVCRGADGVDHLSAGMSSQGPTVGPMTARNVTLIGFRGFYAASSVGNITISDSIASSTEVSSAGQGRDVWFHDAAAHTTLVSTAFDSSFPIAGEYQDWATVTDQLAATPLFRGATDFREDPNSPTIDAGSDAAASGALDLNGNLRRIGADTDMGAYELVSAAPAVTASATSPIAATAASVNGTIDSHSARAYYHLEYGPTAAHGSSTPVRALAASAQPSAVRFDLSGLATDSTVHFSIVATSDGGTSATPNATFVPRLPPPTPPAPRPTLPTPAPIPVTPPVDPGLAGTAGTVKLACRRVTKAGKRRIRCIIRQSNPAEGKARLTLRRVGSRTRVTGRGAVRADGRAVIRLKLARKGKYKATIVLPTPAGTTETIRRTVTIRR